jgi:hypothetical protein
MFPKYDSDCIILFNHVDLDISPYKKNVWRKSSSFFKTNFSHARAVSLTSYFLCPFSHLFYYNYIKVITFYKDKVVVARREHDGCKL